MYCTPAHCSVAETPSHLKPILCAATPIQLSIPTLNKGLLRFCRKLKTAKIPLHLINCLIYGLQMFISFGLMLTAMSFHTGVIASIVTGAVLGKVVLAWPAGTKSTAKIEDEDGCH